MRKHMHMHTDILKYTLAFMHAFVHRFVQRALGIDIWCRFMFVFVVMFLPASIARLRVCMWVFVSFLSMPALVLACIVGLLVHTHFKSLQEKHHVLSFAT